MTSGAAPSTDSALERKHGETVPVGRRSGGGGSNGKSTHAGALAIAGWRVAALLTFAALWELISRTILDPFWISSPSSVVARLWELSTTGELWHHTWTTLKEAVLGLVLGIVVGVAVGIPLARYRTVLSVLEPFILGLYSLPRVALAPLFIIWFGLGLLSKVMMAFSIVVFIVLIATLDGLRSVDQNLVDMMKTMGAKKRQVQRRVLLPSLMPWVMSAVRISVGMALIGAVVGELIGSNAGLGHYVAKSAGLFDTTGIFAGLTSLLVLAIIMNELVRALDRHVLRWRPEVKM